VNLAVSQVNRVFISEPIHVGWIIEKLMRDIAAALNNRGIETRVGHPREYTGQEIVFHSRYLYASPFEQADVNSLFITHIDDRLKEMELRSRIGGFNSFVCTSEAEAQMVKALGCPAGQVVGLALPHRGGVVRRQRVAYFSERYEDGRKNEDWLIEYFQSRDERVRRSMILCLIGYNWETFCTRLAALGLSFELYRYDRALPGEYEAQKKLLEGMDHLIYPGFDGGAMCVYDGVVAGTELLISDNGYHRDLGTGATLFRDRQHFFEGLDRIAARTLDAEQVMSDRSIGPYVDRLLAHWAHCCDGDARGSGASGTRDPAETKTQQDELRFYRAHYKPASPRRLASTLYRQLTYWSQRLRRSPADGAGN
jgi:hypothetical protein